MNQETYAIYYRAQDAFGNPYYSIYQQGITTIESGKRQVIQLMRTRGNNQTASYVLFKEIKTLEAVEVDLDEVLPAPQANPAPDWHIGGIDEDGDDW